MYFKENLSVIMLFIIMSVFIVLIGFLDEGIPNVSIIYLILFNLLILIVYLVWDYLRKRTFSKEFEALHSLNELESIKQPQVESQRKVYDKLNSLRVFHQSKLEDEENRTKENLDELTRFIHDMKMPVTTMKLMINDLDGIHQEKLGNEWNRLNNMLNEVLYLHRLPNIKNDLYIEKFMVTDLVNHSILKLRSICMEKNIGFDLDVENEMVHSDKKWLQFIFDQLLTNSVKYSHDNDIKVKGRNVDDYFQISITDFGRGIKEKDIGRIFEAGFTSTSDHDDDQSTGMGLYLTKEVCEVLNINLSIQSTYGEYTTMTLRFNKANTFTDITMK